jgi:hypothetical protein
MALSMDEQRVLAEIERRLAADDPGLATCLASFRRPGPVTVLRSPRARIVGSLFTVLLVAMVSLMVYALIPFRTHSGRPPAAPASSARASATVALQSSGPPLTPSAGANSGPGGQQSGTQAAGQATAAAVKP